MEEHFSDDHQHAHRCPMPSITLWCRFRDCRGWASTGACGGSMPPAARISSISGINLAMSYRAKAIPDRPSAPHDLVSRFACGNFKRLGHYGVELDDVGDVVDKRQWLTAGVSKPDGWRITRSQHRRLGNAIQAGGRRTGCIGSPHCPGPVVGIVTRPRQSTP